MGDRKDGSGCGGIVVLTCRLWRPQTPQQKSLPVLSQCALCLGHLTLSGAVGPELLGHPGLHQELPLCRLQGRSTLHFLGRLMGPAFLRVAEAAAWASMQHACADFSLVGLGGSPVSLCSLGWKGELRTDSHEELCVFMSLLRVGAIWGGCLEELEQAG